MTAAAAHAHALCRPGPAAVLAAATLLAVAGADRPARADMVSLVAVRDNTLFEDAEGDVSGGQAIRLFAGRTNQGDDYTRRFLLSFDFSSLPGGAVVEQVSLRMQVVQVLDETPRSFGLHRVLASWGEGSSGSSSGGGGGGGGGAPATAGDATWLHRFYSDTLWANPGGDFAAQASSDISVGDFGTYLWSSTPALVADVQGWVDDPAANHGWLMQGDETQGGTAKGFASEEYSLNPDFRPTLFVTYSVVPEAGTLPLVGLGGALLLPVAALRRVARRRRGGSGG